MVKIQENQVTVITQPGEHSYVYSKYLEPIAVVKPGEVVEIHTKDAFGNRVTNENDLPSVVLVDVKGLNPQTGPIYIEGAEPGDTLVVHIIDIQPDRDWAVSALKESFGGLSSTDLTPSLQEPLPEKVWIYKIEDGMVTHNKQLSFPWRPFLGTIGTAPELESISSLTPHKHGGNMDVPDVKPGNKVYLPVKNKGAFFYTGDCHAGQGDGELCGVALEVSARVTLKFELIKQKSIEWPRIESETEYMVVGSARPMEDAAKIAYSELIYWMEEMGWDKFEAYQALTQIGKLYVGNMVDTNYSLVAKIEKKYADVILKDE
ncbi:MULTISPECIES: acetamidase/formamidase family protein [Solibacillus]|uniref:Acetamidase/formamidase family protein n=1 Tax=Solibacillus faecavium TaxID=2762221 RepID=A0ABR8Y2H8_9BACL|nr:acetamidase/formamidase family protein [Solibacillus faecavium]MBD8038398.1 acetamidase/formamidase family protein [Solibacillus faecavium]